MWRPSTKTSIAGSACVVLLAVYAALAWGGVRNRNATFDEVLHAPAAWSMLLLHDFRADPEAPAIWKDWAALPMLWGSAASRPNLRTTDAPWRAIPADSNWQWDWAVQVLYRTPANDADRLINRSRAMMLLAAVALGAIIIAWAGRAGGAVAAVVAALLYCFDPNFLAHGPLVKNDVAAALVWTVAAFVLWRLGRRADLPSVVALGLIGSIGLGTKASMLMLGPLAFGLLAVRALWPDAAWNVFGRQVGRPLTRLAVAVAITTAAGLLAWTTLWAGYGFRFAPTPDPSVRLDTAKLIELTRWNEVMSRHPDHDPTAEELQAWRPRTSLSLISFASRHHVFPQAWLAGFVHVRALAMIRRTYLLGQVSLQPSAMYFPLAILTKTPVATLLAMVLSAAGGFVLFISRRRQSEKAIGNFDSWWTPTCLFISFAIYAVSATFSNLNIGLRHILPLYPLAYVAIGLGAAAFVRARPLFGSAMIVLLAAGLATETLAAYPNFIPFFNAPAGGARRGLALLGDSNLDWGQDLKTLAAWRRQHPEGKLYLAYFGMADPAYYDLDVTHLEGGYQSAPHPQPLQSVQPPAYVAVSATVLQGIYLTADERAQYAALRRQPPVAILGGSIYVYALGNP